MKDLTVLKNDLFENLNDISKDFCDNCKLTENHYICDLFAEYADQAINIYYYDRAKWFVENWQLVDEAIAEFGKSDNIMQDIAAAQFLQTDRQLNYDLDSILQILAIDFLLDHGITKLNDSKIEDLFIGLELLDHNNRVDDIIEVIYNNIDF